MSSQLRHNGYSFLRYSQEGERTSVYPRLRDRVVAFVVIFVVGVSTAVFSDLVLGVSTEIVTYGVVILVILLLTVSPIVSWLFEWKRAVTSQNVMQARQLKVLSAVYVDYAKRLSQLEAERALLIRQSNSVLLHTLMNEGGVFQPGTSKNKTGAVELEAVGTAERVRRELYQGSRTRGIA
jgi:hypothetical protein